jgi:hypothetical protein
VKAANAIESVLRGKAPGAISKVYPLKRVSIRTSKEKISLCRGKTEHRLTVIIGELLFYDCLNGALVSARTAVNADISVDDVHLVALGDCLNGALISASATLDTSVSNLESHDFSS